MAKVKWFDPKAFLEKYPNHSAASWWWTHKMLQDAPSDYFIEIKQPDVSTSYRFTHAGLEIRKGCMHIFLNNDEIEHLRQFMDHIPTVKVGDSVRIMQVDGVNPEIQNRVGRVVRSNSNVITIELEHGRNVTINKCYVEVLRSEQH